MASQSKVGNKTKQELLEYINKVRVVITDTALNCVHVYNDDNKGSSTKVMISDNVELTGYRMHCNDTFVVVALDGGGTGGYMIGNVDDFTKKQCQIVNLSYDVWSIFITSDNKVALGGKHGNVQFDQVDVNGKQTMVWCKKIHDYRVNDIKVHNNKIFTASHDNKCGVITMSDGSVLHMFNAPDSLYCVCVVNDDVILTGFWYGGVYRHDMNTTITTSVFVTPRESEYIPYAIHTLALSNDYNILYCGGSDSTLYAINMKTNNTLLWKTKCENTISSICVQYGIICVGVDKSNVVCVNEHNGEIITTLAIKPQNWPLGIVMIPSSMLMSTCFVYGPKPLPPPIVDPHKQCKEQIQQLTQERDALKQQIQQAQLQISQLKQQLTDSKQKEQQQTQERDAIKQIANEQANKLKIESETLKKAQVQIQELTQERDAIKQIAQQSQFQLQQAQQRIVDLETENNKFKQDQARDRLNSFIPKINKLTGPEVIQIANIFNINLTGVDTTKLATANMLTHASFDEFFDDSNADVVFHDSLLRLYSVIKKAQEIGQFPVENPIAPWIAQQGQPDIAAHFDELKYTEEMMVYFNPTAFAHHFKVRPNIIKKLQTDFIVSQTSVPRLINHDTSSGGVILMPFDPNSPKPSASSS